MKNQILIFGNLFVEKDNTSIKLIPKLKQEFPNIEFIEADPTDDIQKYGKDLKIIDAVEGIDKVKTIKLENESDFERLETQKVYSMHDFDLGYNLKLLKKMKKIDSAEIICVPMDMNEDEVFEEIKKLLVRTINP